MNDLLNFTGISDSASNGAASYDSGLERATFAAGCFWGVEASFREIEGVVRTRVGYTGGTHRRPELRAGLLGQGRATPRRSRCGSTPRWSATSELLDVFWSIHDPTTPNRQGWDFGSQYRSAIFFHDAEQERLAIASRDERQAELARPIVTEIVAASPFYDAEDYHQRYFEKHGGAVCADHAAVVRALSPPRARGMARGGRAAASGRGADDS